MLRYSIGAICKIRIGVFPAVSEFFRKKITQPFITKVLAVCGSNGIRFTLNLNVTKRFVTFSLNAFNL